MAEDFYDVIEKLEQEESSGGKGYICKARICFGYKAFVTGAKNADSLFEFDPADQAGRARAMELAKKFIDDNGGTTRVQACACIIIYKDSVYNREVTWQENRYWTIPMWTPKYREIMKPKMKEVGIQQVGDYFCQISFVPDPTSKVEDSYIPYVKTLFANESEAKLAAGSQKSVDSNLSLREESNDNIPMGWTTTTWEQATPDIKQAKLNGQSPAEIANDYGVEVRFIVSALKS
jgi:hypothetical protein